MTRPGDDAIAAVHALQLMEIAEGLGVSVAPLLAKCGVEQEQLLDPSARLSFATVEALIEHVRAASGEPGLGFMLGSRVRVTSHGHAGLGILAAKNLRQAIEFSCRFSPIRARIVSFSLTVQGDTAGIWIEERVPLGSARDVVLFGIATGFWLVGNVITGTRLEGDIELAMPEPEYFARYREFGAGQVHFDMPGNVMKFPAALLDLPLPAADATTYRLACEICERELAALMLDESYVVKVERLFQDERACAYTLPEAAKALGTSERTLKRRLGEQRVSYSQLVDDARKRHALQLLQSASSIQEIAERLGYTDAANFTRAFRRWTGQSPRLVRQKASR